MKLFPYLGAILAIGLFVAFMPPIAIYFMNLDNVLVVATSPLALVILATALMAALVYDMFPAPRMDDGGRLVTPSSVLGHLLASILSVIMLVKTWANDLAGHARRRMMMASFHPS